MEILYYILVFILGFVFGSFIVWTYNQVTDKVQMAKTGYSLGKRLLIYLINKFKKKNESGIE